MNFKIKLFLSIIMPPGNRPVRQSAVRNVGFYRQANLRRRPIGGPMGRAIASIASGIGKCKSLANAKQAWNNNNKNKFRNSIAFATGYRNLYRNIAQNLIRNGVYQTNKSTQLRQLINYFFLLKKSGGDARTQKILGNKIGELIAELYLNSKGNSKYKNAYSGIIRGIILKTTGKKELANLANNYLRGNYSKIPTKLVGLAKNPETVRFVKNEAKKHATAYAASLSARAMSRFTNLRNKARRLHPALL
jgi:DNA-binding ferritin-like protein (Dps family)